MKIYNYDAQTGEFISDGDSAPSPLEDGVFLIPAYATTDAPPDAEAGHARVFNGSTWVQAVDLRGTHYWDADGTEYVMESLGEMPDDALLAKPEPVIPPAPTPTDAVLAQMARMRRDLLISMVQWRATRYEHQTALSVATADTHEQYVAVLTYIQALRDVPSQSGFPATIDWPVAPA